MSVYKSYELYVVVLKRKHTVDFDTPETIFTSEEEAWVEVTDCTRRRENCTGTLADGWRYVVMRLDDVVYGLAQKQYDEGYNNAYDNTYPLCY